MTAVIKAVLWDLDGVIVDSGQAHYKAWVKILAEYGVNFSWGQFTMIFGIPNEPAVELILGKDKATLLWQEISDKKETEFLNSVRGNVTLLPGVLLWLNTLRIQGIPCAIASSAPMPNIDAVVDETHIRDLFQSIVSGVGHPGKPDPWVFQEAARRINIPAEHCLVIEDSIPGLTGAKAAGMKCLAVTTTNPADKLLQNHADWVVDSLEEIPVDHVITK